jgi:hypothetical protein
MCASQTSKKFRLGGRPKSSDEVQSDTFILEVVFQFLEINAAFAAASRAVRLHRDAPIDQASEISHGKNENQDNNYLLDHSPKLRILLNNENVTRIIQTSVSVQR